MLRPFIRLTTLLTLAGAALTLALLTVAPATSHAAHAAHNDRPALRQARFAAATPFTINLQLIDNGLSDPVHLTHAGDGSGRLFVVEQAGRIRVIKNGALLSTPFLSITNRVQSEGEQGLLSVAFDPDYATNGAFYVNYTSRVGVGDTVIARYVVSNPAADVANPIAVTHLITIEQPQANHNGGQLQFGPNDDYLYIGMGDGGGGSDSGSGHAAGGNGQFPGTLLGKLLRLNVRGVPTYTIPASNPFTQTMGYRPEIWALGLRNPWRFAFDRATGDLYIGDVGQNCYEEVSYQPGGSSGGENYGWRLMEGFHQFDPADPDNCNRPLITPAGVTLPISEYGRNLGSTVTGGYVYRGSDYPWLDGVYFFADYGSGRIWSLEQVSPGNWGRTEQRNESFAISSFGEDEGGELYLLRYSDNDNGAVYKITSAAPADLSTSQKSASNTAPAFGERVTYTIVLRNTGAPFSNTLRLTDTVPAGLAYLPGSLGATRGAPDASAAPALKWSGVMSNVSVVTVTYAVTVSTGITQTINNTVTINPGLQAPFTRSASILVNGLRWYLPVVFKNG
ncbi:MAG TPA: PQQ-dependent sugar dehydrogenase [Anaerolineae bacterium]|nr:PQQ-dependent sugar dehydrogenase [Anaerolineae bacterium]